MEHSKGKMTQGKSNTLLYINGKCFGDVLVGGLSHEECEANAAENLHRWNAFEDGGIVDELKVACEVGLDSMRGMLEMAIKIGASNKDKKEHAEHIKFVEAALAKS